ncbi:MAG: hypothetical protein ACOCVM_09625, partial [Desulfovibrionaceae bacterium]
AMRQGDHEIIIRGSAKIKEDLERIQKKENEQKKQLEETSAKFAEYLAVYNDPGSSRQERIEAHAKSLEAGAGMNKAIADLSEASLKTLEQVDDNLETIVEACRSIDQSNEAAVESVVEVDSMARALLANQAKLDQIIVDVQDGTITPETRRELELSHNLHAGAHRYREATKRVFQNGKLADHMQNLRENVGKRRNHTLAMHKVAQGNLGIIRAQVTGAIAGEATRELDELLGSFTSLEDPLGLEAPIMQPDTYGQLIYPGGAGNTSAASTSDSTSGRGFGLDYSAFGDQAP